MFLFLCRLDTILGELILKKEEVSNLAVAVPDYVSVNIITFHELNASPHLSFSSTCS